jgi:uncharacterized NAD(P)/FAD-binding protein YdhS
MIPPVNAEKLRKMIVEGRLTVLGGIEGVRQAGDGGFVVYTRERPTPLVCDAIANVSGPSAMVEQGTCPLLAMMITRGYAVPHAYGGVKVDYDTAAVLDSRGVADPGVFAIGHVTSARREPLPAGAQTRYHGFERD